MLCLIKDCARKYYANGYCQHHYDKNRRHGSPLFQRIVRKKLKCSADKCELKQFAKGFCNTHYVKIKKSGTLEYKIVYGEASKEKSRARTAKWKKDNWAYYKAYLLNRKHRIRSATPPWVDKKQILEFYNK